MRTMTREEWLQFVSTGTRTGKLASTRASGGPHVTPIWFLIDPTPDGDDVVFTTHSSSVKAKTLARDPRFAMVVDDQQPPYSYVLLQGEASLSEDPEELLAWATRLGGRYMGDAEAEAFGRRNGVPGELLVRGRISKVIAYADVSG